MLKWYYAGRQWLMRINRIHIPVDTIVLSGSTITAYGTDMFCVGHQQILATITHHRRR